MPPDQPEKEPGPSKKDRRSRSSSMTQPQVVVDLTESAGRESSRSRKHDRHQEDSQADGPSKRAKLNRNSEPPTRKNTSTTPRSKRKKSREKVNHHKVSRTNKHHGLQERSKTLEGDFWVAKQVLKKKKQEHKDMKTEFAWNSYELKRVRKICAENSEELQKQRLKMEADHEEIRSLKGSCSRKDEELKAKDAIIVSQQTELDEAERSRKQAEDVAEAARILNDSNGAHNDRVLQREHTAKEKLKKERKVHENRVLDLKEEKHELQQELADLETRLENQENHSSEVITRLQLQLQDSQPQSQRYNFKVSDEKVKQDFANLQSKIRQFVDNYTRPVHNATDQELQIGWPNWSLELREFLSSPLLCHLVFEGYIWEYLLARVFKPWSKIWVGNLGRPLEKALRIAGHEVESTAFESEPYVDYQYWRTNSSSFINSLNGGDFRPQHFESDVETIVSNLQKLCEFRGFAGDMKADAIGIFEDARAFEIQLRMLKAVYTLVMCKSVPSGGTYKCGVLFGDEDMVDLSPSPSDKKDGRVPVVDFITSPGLHKRGNNDGDKYEDNNCTWQVKMGVVCDAFRFFMGPATSTTVQPTSVQIPNALLYSGEVMTKDKDQDSVLQNHTGFAQNDVNIQTPISGSANIKVEDEDSQLTSIPSSTPGLASASPAPRSEKYSLRPTPPKKAGSSAVKLPQKRL